MSALALLAGATVFRLAASRQPYRRAGLAIAARGVFTIVPREQLDAEKVFALLVDPVVDMAIAAEEGGDWTVLSSDQREAIAKEIADLTAPLGVAAEQVEPSEIERLRAIEDEHRAEVSRLVEVIAVARGERDAFAAQVADLKAELTTAQADGALLTKRIAELVDDLAKATKPTVKAAGKLKPAE